MRLNFLRKKLILIWILALFVVFGKNIPVFAVFSATDTAVSLSGSGINLVITSGSTLASYSVSATVLTLELDAGNSVTVKSADSYILTNSQNSTTQCSGTDYSYVSFTAGAPMTITITPAATAACQSSGGGSGGSAVNLPTITFFQASASKISLGQSSVLSWQVSGATSLAITPAVSPGTLLLSGSITVAPTSTTAYLLTAKNFYGQSVTASATVTVEPASQPTLNPPATVNPPVENPEIKQPALPEFCLVNNRGNFSLILYGTRHPIANPGLLHSWGYNFSDAALDTAIYQALPTGSLLLPNDGALVKEPNNPTIYLISKNLRHGFISAAVFKALGYKFSSVLTVPKDQLQALAVGDLISSESARHLPGVIVSNKNTVYRLGENSLDPYPSLAVYNSWNLKNDFSRVVPASKEDLKLPLGPVIGRRTGCEN